jgi:alkyldihydroxyacetonephosphate synthase
MKRWNGWGDAGVDYPLHEGPHRYLTALVGLGKPPAQASLDQVVAAVPISRLPAHTLVSDDPESRARHARGQSLPDWIALRFGTIPAFPDGVAYPSTDAEVIELIKYAGAVGARIIPYGGGTSVVGHINPPRGGAPILTLDLGRLNGLRRFDETSLLATFGAGITGPDLEAQLSPIL